ncbi:MAG TPA: glycosyltransferase [Ideonella sp.]|uniref:glycosyltransferase family 2 protein n=1 Tax=Ideonella sp. TaxID=1929293 RepID=UPI002E375CF7|nr:glycosyltransferase [Ideonella sp.]HEX5687770.1 glycosyltransferase [Ideonella sp.]
MAAPTPARLVVERLSGIAVVGWAFDPQAPGQEALYLVCGEQTFAAPVRRQQRMDVCRAVGAGEALALGFEIDLPLSIWPALGQAGAALGVRIGENGAIVKSPAQPTAAGLRSWMATLAQSPDVQRAQAEQAALAPHLEQAVLWGDGGAVPKAPPPAPVSCNVEGWQGLALGGWLADSPEAREPLRLRCGDRRYEVPVRRVSRGDVSSSLKLPHDEVGFLLEVPGSLWGDQPSGADELVLQLEGRGGPLGPEWRLKRSELPARLDEALAWPDPLQRSHLALLAMEHLAWAGGLGDIDDTARQALAVLAESVGAGAWLDQDPRLLVAPAERLRHPFRIAPRGRLGRWLQKAANADRAFRLLTRLQSRPGTAGLAKRLELTLTHALGLFDKACYDEQISPAERGGMPALRHYVEQGDARSLVPMALFDARHYTGQLKGRRHPGINRLLHYGLVGRHQGLSPCAWFDAAYYLSTNADVRGSGADPLIHFVNWGWKERRRPAARFEPTTGTRQGLLQRLSHVRGGEVAATVDPLQRFLLDGLPADAQPNEPGRLPWAVPSRLDGRDYLELNAWRNLPQPAAQPRVDVIVPVYAGAQETLRCLWSVLSSWVDTPYQLVVIDDCSPEPALSAHLRELAALGLIHLMVNERNRGFVATVNKGLKLHWDRDVVILNSDTRVHPGWLDRLVAHGEAEPRAASITPLSNNATVCSYPRMLHSNWERLELDDGALDALAATVNRGRHVEVPTGVGFCMWMRRSALDAVGLLDVERFGRGYGEENDWCMRANAAGWVQLVASDVYVLHQGSVSFSAEASARTRAGIATLLQRHPDYQQRIDDWIAHDPLLPERARLDAARLKRATEVAIGGGLVLMVNHARGGGTARHEAEEAARLRAERGLGVVTMHPSRRPGCVALGATGGLAGTLDLPALQAVPLLTDGRYGPRHPAQALLDVLAALDLREVQLHHLVDHPPVLRELLPGLCKALDVPLSVTVHDYHLICPRINLVDASGRYCGEPDRDTCDRCLQRDDEGRAAGRIGAWRAAHSQLLTRAQQVIVPDEDVAARLSNYFPAVRVRVQPHEPLHLPANPLPRGTVRKLLVVGALSPIKGLNVLLGLARSRAAAELGLRFTLLGHSSDDAALRAAGVQVLGRYEDKALPGRIAELAPDMILLPSVWPETFCYVLTAAAESGRPIAVFNLGAQARRLKEAKAPAVYLPIELAGQPELLARALVA